MKEVNGNVFDLMLEPETDSICITTNGIIGADGKAIMGAGTAGEAARRWSTVRSTLGKALKTFGNLPYVIGFINLSGEFQETNATLIKEKQYKCLIWSFPTKNDFRKKSDIDLIKKSATLMAAHADSFELKRIILPAPGTGAATGKLSWESEVKPVIQDILDDRFIISFL